MEITWGAAWPGLKAYYFLVFISFIYLALRYRKRQISLFIILIFFNGLFAFLGKDIQNYYRIALVVYLILVLMNSSSVYRSIRQTKSVLFSFIVFSLTFLFTSFINNDYFFIIFSQYSRYFILFSLSLLFLKSM